SGRRRGPDFFFAVFRAGVTERTRGASCQHGSTPAARRVDLRSGGKPPILPAVGTGTVRIAARFCGPPASAHGGHFAGIVAGAAARTVTVRLIRPPPLDPELTLEELPDGALRVSHGTEAIGEARPAPLALAVPAAPDYLAAVEASRHYAGFRYA